MSYFRELPNISYLSLLPDASTNEDSIVVKNLFKRAKIRTDIINAITAFEYYQITDNERPDIIASKFYGDPELDWIILTVNNITNMRTQWPLNNNDLYNYMIDKYKSDDNLFKTHHYETTEVKDEYDRLVLKGGLEVDKDFTITYKTFNNVLMNLNPVKEVTNYDYENKINEEKRKIRILKNSYLSVVITDMRNIMKYDRSSQYINENTKGTYNPNLTGV